MSCYNAERWLGQAISSVLNQTYKDFELIIIDDGSEDDTLGIMRRFAETDSRIVIVGKPNTGPADSRNVGIQKASGEWIAVLDADDLCEPTRLQRQLALAQAKPEVVLVGTGFTEIDEYGNRLRIHRYPTRHALLLEALRTGRRFPPHSSCFYSTRTLRAIGGFRAALKQAEDWDLWLRLSERGDLACLSEPLVRIRKHAAQISNAAFGRTQVVDGHVVMTSYWLRQQGFLDPISDDATRYGVFRAWIERRLVEEGMLAFQTFKAGLRRAFYGSRNSPVGLFRTLVAFLNNPDLVPNLIQERLSGNKLPQRLAREWISRSLSCAASQS
jgi:glycosyltransferase involved in cell wall biosynthesis